MLIAIPSKGRAGNLTSLRELPSARVFVPHLEAEAYRSFIPDDQVIEVPDEVTGITRTRNWIIDYAKDQGEIDLVMVDDDVKASGFIQVRDEKMKSVRSMREAIWRKEFLKLFGMARGMKYRIWGTSTTGEPRAWYTYRPFLFRTYVTASCMGICLESGIRFDESYPVKEDYEICLRCIQEDGGVLGCRYLYWQNSHWDDDGGCKSYRTQQMEREMIRKLVDAYPGMIRQVVKGGSEWSIQLNFPAS